MDRASLWHFIPFKCYVSQSDAGKSNFKSLRKIKPQLFSSVDNPVKLSFNWILTAIQEYHIKATEQTLQLSRVLILH